MAFWDRLRGSYWFVPSLLVLGATILAFTSVELERSKGGLAPIWMPRIFASGPEGARAVLSAIASSMITVASLVFSLTIVALTLASAQFGPRLIRNFMRDTADQVVLGAFIATFLYSLLVLRSVDNHFVPVFSVGLAVIMVVACVLLLVFFIHHVATNMQVESVIANVSRELHETLGRLLPEEESPDEVPELPEAEPDTLGAPETGYVQGLDTRTLVQLAREHDTMIRVDVRPGHFVIEGSPILRSWPAGRLSNPPQALRLACVIGRGRTFTQDIEFGLLQLVEVAVRALSPGINDPFTACACLDRLGAALAFVIARARPHRTVRDEDGTLRLTLDQPEFSGHAAAAFNQIRQNGAGNPAVLIRMLEVMRKIAQLATSEEVRGVLQLHGRLVFETAERNLDQPEDRADVQRAWELLETEIRRKSDAD